MHKEISLEVLILLSLLTVFSVIIGKYMAKVFSGASVLLSPLLRPLELCLYRLFGIDKNLEMNWKTYARNLVTLNIIAIVILFLLIEAQGFFPLNPQKFGSLHWDEALNIAISFATNTDWQVYGGESTLSYLTQMLGLTVLNFLSAAIGISVAIAFIRAFTKKSTTELGNFWVDLTRSIVYVLLPLSIVFSIILMSQGVIQNFNHYVEAVTLEGSVQTIAQGPVASQVAIKHIGTNGGGFFNANSAHPYENPNPTTDFLQILALLLIPTALPFTFGSMIKNQKQGWILYAAIMTLFLIGLLVSIYSEAQGNPLLAKLGVQNGSNMEGKEARFGLLNSVVFSQSTTATGCGAVNNMHDSLMPLTGLVLMFNMMIGEVILGGVGVGLIGILAYGILTMFLIGLMIGRTPEIFGKKLESYEMIMTVCLLMLPSFIQLLLGSLAISTSAGLSSLNEHGPHGLSQVIYAFASGAGNNGSAFAGLNANTFFYNTTMSLTMLIGRFAVLIPALAIAGSLANKKQVPIDARFPTETPLFACMLVFVVLIVGALTFFPVLVMGPFLEHLFIQLGETF